MFCEVRGSHSDVVEDSGLLGCEAVLLGWGFTTTRRSVARSSSMFRQSKKIFLVCLILEDSFRTGLLDRWRRSSLEASGTLKPQRVTSLKNWIQKFLLVQAYNVIIIFIFWATLRNFTDFPANTMFPAVHVTCINLKFYTVNEILIGLCKCQLIRSFPILCFVVSFLPFLVTIFMFLFSFFLSCVAI